MAVAVFRYTGAVQTFTVPAGVTAVYFDVAGAGGGGLVGGYGGRVAGFLPVTAGQVYNIYVGGGGKLGNGISVGGVGGFNGGGTGGPTAGQPGFYPGASGGGASDIRFGGTALANRIAVAGGGGGQAGQYPGNSGGTGGGYETSGTWPGLPGGGLHGGGGGNNAGGAAGDTGFSGATAGALGVGGNGGGNSVQDGPGGGGGGLYGGGGGGLGVGTGLDPSGGGGGQGYLSGSFTSQQGGTRQGSSPTLDGLVVVYYAPAPSAPTLIQPVGGASVEVSGPQDDFVWHYSNTDPVDAQTLADVQYRVVGAGAWTSRPAAATDDNRWTPPADEFVAGNTYEWQVRTYNQAGVVGPYSASSQFVAVAQGFPFVLLGDQWPNYSADGHVTDELDMQARIDDKINRLANYIAQFGGRWYRKGVLLSLVPEVDFPIAGGVSGTVVNWPVVKVNDGSDYAAGVVTVKKDGLYVLNAVVLQGITGSTSETEITLDGVPRPKVQRSATTIQTTGSQISTVQRLTAGTQVKVTNWFPIHAVGGFFQVYKIGN